MQSVKVFCVCSFCRKHSKENVSLEINFSDQSIFFLCPECKKMNQLVFDNPKLKPYPKGRVIK